MNWTMGARAIRFYREEGKGKGGPERRKRVEDFRRVQYLNKHQVKLSLSERDRWRSVTDKGGDKYDRQKGNKTVLELEYSTRSMILTK